MTFEEDYFNVPTGTCNPYITELALKFVDDPYKAPEQVAQARDYLKRNGL